MISQEAIGSAHSGHQQLERLQKRIRLAMSELDALVASQPIGDGAMTKPHNRAEQHDFERRCVCLEVAIDEVIRWARALQVHVNAHREQAAPTPAELTLQVIDQLLGQIVPVS